MQGNNAAGVQGALERASIPRNESEFGARMYSHYKHKRDPLRFLYHVEGRRLSDPSPEYAAIQNWDKIEEFESIENVPEDLQAKPDDDVATVPEDAFVIVDGIRVIPLTQPIVNIGRRVENTLVIDDPRVSRTHAQLRAINGRYIIFDLNSTGGTFINGERVTQSILYPGDVISLAGADLIYGQKNPPPRQDLKETSPL